MAQRTFTMKTALSHLPEHRIAWIAEAARRIREFAPVEMIILFGSYARGDYVEDPVGKDLGDDWGPMPYFSDLDLCILVKGGKQARRIERSRELVKRLTRPDGKMKPQLIVHTVNYFNRALESGEFFFVDIAKEGILLYTSGNHEISQPKALTDEERKAKQEQDYDFWKGKGDEFIGLQADATRRDLKSLAAFLLHQAAEHYLAAACLVLSGYRPKGHDLEKLETWAAQFDPTFRNILPRETAKDAHLFKLLQAAYVDARYKSKFRIEESELEELKEKVFAVRDKLETLKP